MKEALNENTMEQQIHEALNSFVPEYDRFPSFEDGVLRA